MRLTDSPPMSAWQNCSPCRLEHMHRCLHTADYTNPSCSADEKTLFKKYKSTIYLSVKPELGMDVNQ